MTESENLSKSVSYDEEKVLVSEVDSVFFSIVLVFYAWWLHVYNSYIIQTNTNPHLMDPNEMLDAEDIR